MKITSAFHISSIGILFGLFVAGCGGASTTPDPKTSSISGVVTDIDGQPVRGARVSTVDSSTITSVSGSYALPRNREEDLVVTAELNQDGVNFSGRNIARTFIGEQTQSVNIVVSPDGDQAVLRGQVQDFSGNDLEGISVFAFGGGLSSSRAITDSNGDYVIRGLVPGFSYTVNAGGRGYESAEDAVILEPRETRTLDFVLGQGSSLSLFPPENLSAVSWTAPVANRSVDSAAYNAIKKLFDPRHRSSAIQRTTPSGRQIEIELFWDSVLSLDLLGYGIYRAVSDGSFDSVNFLREPIAGYYADLDPVVASFNSYTYAVTSLNTSYPEGSQSESEFSNHATIRTLGDLTLAAISTSPLTFRWNSGSGAEEFVVFVFDRFPGVGVESLWNSAPGPTTSLSQVYLGPALQPGARYYTIVLGLANGSTSRALSEIGSFIAP